MENFNANQPPSTEKVQVETITPMDLRCGWLVEVSKGGISVGETDELGSQAWRHRPFSCKTPACHNPQSIGPGPKQSNLLPWRT